MRDIVWWSKLLLPLAIKANEWMNDFDFKIIITCRPLYGYHLYVACPPAPVIVTAFVAIASSSITQLSMMIFLCSFALHFKLQLSWLVKNTFISFAKSLVFKYLIDQTTEKKNMQRYWLQMCAQLMFVLVSKNIWSYIAFT